MGGGDLLEALEAELAAFSDSSDDEGATAAAAAAAAPRPEPKPKPAGFRAAGPARGPAAAEAAAARPDHPLLVNGRWRDTGIRVRAPLVGVLTLEDRVEGLDFFQLGRVAGLAVARGNEGGPWATLGVIGEKSRPRTTSNGGSYLILTLCDLRGAELKLFLFGDAFKDHWTEPAGTVVVVRRAKTRVEKGNAPSISVQDPDQLFKVGTAADFAVCRGIRKDGHKCTKVIHRGEGEYCEYHAGAMAKRLNKVRKEVGGGNLGMALTRRRGAGKASEGGGGASGLLASSFKKATARKAFADLGTNLGRGLKRPRKLEAGGAADRGPVRPRAAAKGPAPPKQGPLGRRGSKANGAPGSGIALPTKAKSEVTRDRTFQALAAARGFDAAAVAGPANASAARQKAAAMVRSGAAKLEKASSDYRKPENKDIRRREKERAATEARRRPAGPGSRGRDAAAAAAAPAAGRAARAKAAPSRKGGAGGGSGGGSGALAPSFAATFGKFVTKEDCERPAIFAAAAEAQEMKAMNKKLDAYSQQDQIHEKLKGTTSLKVKAYLCVRCNKAFERYPAHCQKAQHSIKEVQRTKRFFECVSCKHRVTTLDTHPIDPCPKCRNPEKRFRRAGMARDKKVDAPDLAARENLKTRGTEHGFSYSARKF